MYKRVNIYIFFLEVAEENIFQLQEALQHSHKNDKGIILLWYKKQKYLI